MVILTGNQNEKLDIIDAYVESFLKNEEAVVVGQDPFGYGQKYDKHERFMRFETPTVSRMLEIVQHTIDTKGTPERVLLVITSPLTTTIVSDAGWATSREDAMALIKDFANNNRKVNVVVM